MLDDARVLFTLTKLVQRACTGPGDAFLFRLLFHPISFRVEGRESAQKPTHRGAYGLCKRIVPRIDEYAMLAKGQSGDKAIRNANRVTKKAISKMLVICWS